MYNLALLNCEQDIDLKMDFMNIIDLCTAAKNQENTVLSWGARQCFPRPLASGACCPLPKNPPCSRPLALISALRAYSAVSSNSLSFIGYSKENLKIHTGVPSLPALPFFPSPAFPSLSPSPPFLYPLPLEVGTLKSS